LASWWDALPWEWFGIIGGLGCSALCGLFCVGLVGVAIWRVSKQATDSSSPALPALPPDSPALLTGPLGYIRTGEFEYSRERWGRPLLYTCTLEGGATWQADAVGRRICVREHSDRNPAPAGLSLAQTGDGALDLRFATYCSSAQDAGLLADPELRDHLLSVPWVHVVADGQTVQMRDPGRQAMSLALNGISADSADATPTKMRLHDTVGDVLVMLADRLS